LEVAPRIILASGSPRRSALLRQMGLEFEVVPSDVAEENVPVARPASYAKRLARLKAREVSKQVSEGIIIGADTVVCLGDRIFGKPKDTDDATNTLRLLGGKVHRVITGICVMNKYSKTAVTKAVTTKVKFRELEDKLIDWYVHTGEPMDKSGCYGIQGKGAVLVEWIKGDYSNVVGLPIATLSEILEGMGFSQMESEPSPTKSGMGSPRFELGSSGPKPESLPG
jgi:septum formation protein